MPHDAKFAQELCADVQGFSLHAAERCAADDRQALKQLCRTITRPALANERVQCNAAGQVVLRLMTALRDGSAHIVRTMGTAAPGAFRGRQTCPGSACSPADDLADGPLQRLLRR